jgi:DNA-binding HxlR family transcriptional regulator
MRSRALPHSVQRCAPEGRSPCPVAKTLDLLGDKWSLLVVRDAMLFGKRRFGEFAASPEGIPTNILADRLRRLEERGILRKTAYQKNPLRYEYRLTSTGKELFPVLKEMIRWARHHLPGTGKSSPGPLTRAGKAMVAEIRAKG